MIEASGSIFPLHFSTHFNPLSPERRLGTFGIAAPCESMPMTDSPRRNYYKLVQVSRIASPAEIKASYHRLLSHHPTSQTRPRKIQLERTSISVRSRKHSPPFSPQNHGSGFRPSLSDMIACGIRRPYYNFAPRANVMVSEIALYDRGIPPPRSSSVAFEPLVPKIAPLSIGLLSGCSHSWVRIQTFDAHTGSDTNRRFFPCSIFPCSVSLFNISL